MYVCVVVVSPLGCDILLFATTSTTAFDVPDAAVSRPQPRPANLYIEQASERSSDRSALVCDECATDHRNLASATASSSACIATANTQPPHPEPLRPPFQQQLLHHQRHRARIPPPVVVFAALRRATVPKLSPPCSATSPRPTNQYNNYCNLLRYTTTMATSATSRSRESSSGSSAAVVVVGLRRSWPCRGEGPPRGERSRPRAAAACSCRSSRDSTCRWR